MKLNAVTAKTVIRHFQVKLNQPALFSTLKPIIYLYYMKQLILFASLKKYMGKLYRVMLVNRRLQLCNQHYISFGQTLFIRD